jgi:type II secretory ATPase GspE/PulE/Tfp pilus assembly ATPase PilB-like protein
MYAVDKEMQGVILKNPVESEIYAVARKNGMLSMREDALVKCSEGTVPLQEVYNFNMQ